MADEIRGDVDSTRLCSPQDIRPRKRDDESCRVCFYRCSTRLSYLAHTGARAGFEPATNGYPCRPYGIRPSGLAGSRTPVRKNFEQSYYTLVRFASSNVLQGAGICGASTSLVYLFSGTRPPRAVCQSSVPRLLAARPNHALPKQRRGEAQRTCCRSRLWVAHFYVALGATACSSAVCFPVETVSSPKGEATRRRESFPL